MLSISQHFESTEDETLASHCILIVAL